MNRFLRPLFKASLFATSALALTQCQVMGPPAAPPHVMVLPAARFEGVKGVFGNATQVVVHRSVPEHKLEAAFPRSEGYARIFSPVALRLVANTLNSASLTPMQRQSLTRTASDISHFEQSRRLAIQAAVGAGPPRFRMLQRATFR